MASLKREGEEMSKANKLCLLILSFVFVLSGCVVRTYQVTKDRADQDLSGGNRGYLQGSAPAEEAKERKATRTTQIVEVELRSPVKFEKAPKAQSKEGISLPKNQDQEALGNRGYITQSETAPILEPSAVNIEKYKVQKGDTLQKISKKFYGTTKKWNKIFEANRNVLKGPNSVYLGQVIDIPVDPLKETKENLK